MGDKLREGQALIEAGEKALKGGFFRGPDYNKACDCYAKAANAFKKVRALEQAKDAFKREAAMQEKLDSAFHAGKALENASQMAKDLKQIGEAADLLNQAANYYREYGAPDTAGLTMEKAAKLLEESAPEKAIQQYMEAADLHTDEAKGGNANTCLYRAACLAVKLKKYDQAMDALKLIMKRYAEMEGGAAFAGKAYLSAVVVALAMGDLVGANLIYQQGMGATAEDSVDMRLAGRMWTAFDEGDQEALEAVQKRQEIGFLDNEIAKLARSIRVPGSAIKKKPAAPKQEVQLPVAPSARPSTSPTPSPTVPVNKPDVKAAPVAPELVAVKDKNEVPHVEGELVERMKEVSVGEGGVQHKQQEEEEEEEEEEEGGLC